MRPPLGSAPDYFAALAAKRRRGLIVLAGKPRAVPRAAFRLHYELRDILTRQDAPLDRIRRYTEAATGFDCSEIQAEELLAAFEALTALNAPAQTPSLIRAATAKGGPAHKVPLALQYPGRWVASIVHTLAKAYGWTAGDILDQLGPEEVWLLMQEVLYDEHQERAFQRSLSNVGRDKRGRQKKMPEPAWLLAGYPEIEAEKGRHAPPIPESMKPTGVGISLVPRVETA